MKDDTRCAYVAVTQREKQREKAARARSRARKGSAYAGEEREVSKRWREGRGRGAKRGSGREERREEERGRKEKERNADRIISNAPQHVAPAGSTSRLSNLFLPVCHRLSLWKVQRERGCRINWWCPILIFVPEIGRRQKEFDVVLEVGGSRKPRRVTYIYIFMRAADTHIHTHTHQVRSEIHRCRNTTGGANSDH